MAVVPLARPALSAALQQPCRSPLGRPHLHKDPPGPHQPVLCRRLCVWPHPADMLSRCGRSNPKAHQTTRPRAVAGGYYYTVGSYTCSGGKWKGEMTSREHSPISGTYPWARKDISIGFTGTYSNDRAEFEAT